MNVFPTPAEGPIRRRVVVCNIPIVIEYPAGSTKFGEDDDGHAWARVYLLDYGFIEGGPNSADGETMDVYLGPHREAPYVFVVNQLEKDGTFDEHKALIGFVNQEEALAGYLRHYPAGWEKDRVQSVKPMTVMEFRKWLKTPGVTKAAAVWDIRGPEIGPTNRTPDFKPELAKYDSTAGSSYREKLWEDPKQREALTKKYKTRFDAVKAKLEGLQFPLTVYRAVKMEGEVSLRTTWAGISWTDRLECARFYTPAGRRGKGQTYILRAQVTPEQVDWVETWNKNMEPYANSGQREQEVALVQGVPVTINGIKGPTDADFVPRSLQVTAASLIPTTNPGAWIDPEGKVYPTEGITHAAMVRKREGMPSLTDSEAIDLYLDRGWIRLAFFFGDTAAMMKQWDTTALDRIQSALHHDPALLGPTVTITAATATGNAVRIPSDEFMAAEKPSDLRAFWKAAPRRAAALPIPLNLVDPLFSELVAKTSNALRSLDPTKKLMEFYQPEDVIAMTSVAEGIPPTLEGKTIHELSAVISMSGNRAHESNILSGARQWGIRRGDALDMTITLYIDPTKTVGYTLEVLAQPNHWAYEHLREVFLHEVTHVFQWDREGTGYVHPSAYSVDSIRDYFNQPSEMEAFVQQFVERAKQKAGVGGIFYKGEDLVKYVITHSPVWTRGGMGKLLSQANKQKLFREVYKALVREIGEDAVVNGVKTSAKILAAALDLPPIQWSMPSDAELLNEVRTEYTIEKLFVWANWPKADDYTQAVHELKAASGPETLDPHRIGGRHLWKSYDDLKRTVTSFGGPKNPDSMVTAIREGNPLPMPVVLRHRDGRLEVVGGNTRSGIAALAGQPVTALVIDESAAQQATADRMLLSAKQEWYEQDPTLFKAVEAYYLHHGPKPVITKEQGFAAYNLSSWFGMILHTLGQDSTGLDVRLRPVLEEALDVPKTSAQRKFWGKAGASILYVAEDTGRALVAHRSEDVNEPGTWGVWGGAAHEDESPETAATREAGEETGYHGPLRLQKVSTYRSGSFTYTTFLGFVPTEFTPKLDWETQDFRWVVPGEWPKPIHFGLKAALPGLHVALETAAPAPVNP